MKIVYFQSVSWQLDKLFPKKIVHLSFFSFLLFLYSIKQEKISIHLSFFVHPYLGKCFTNTHVNNP